MHLQQRVLKETNRHETKIIMLYIIIIIYLTLFIPESDTEETSRGITKEVLLYKNKYKNCVKILFLFSGSNLQKMQTKSKISFN